MVDVWKPVLGVGEEGNWDNEGTTMAVMVGRNFFANHNDKRRGWEEMEREGREWERVRERESGREKGRGRRRERGRRGEREREEGGRPAAVLALPSTAHGRK